MKLMSDLKSKVSCFELDGKEDVENSTGNTRRGSPGSRGFEGKGDVDFKLKSFRNVS